MFMFYFNEHDMTEVVYNMAGWNSIPVFVAMPTIQSYITLHYITLISLIKS